VKLVETELHGLYVIELDIRQRDERGFFARAWSRGELEDLGIDAEVQQCSISFNEKRGTLRGMHYQDEPFTETKFVRCTAGRIFDVALDLRQYSPTFRQWYGRELSQENRQMMLIPPGVAHGFQTLDDASEVFYQISQIFVPEAAKGVRWNDPAFGIEWPEVERRIISPRDQSFEDYGG
jgi:dTDP-4-dehydrorhamnose 3,5-epimerase